MSIYKKLNLLFYLSLPLSFIIFLIPSEFKIAVYSPNYLGWFLLIILLPTTLISFIWLTVLDFKKNNKQNSVKRFLLLFIIIVLSIIYWKYKVNA